MTGVPLLAVSRQEARVVILNYALTAEQLDPCGPEPYSPGNWPRTRFPLGEGLVTPHVPEEVALSQNSWGPRTPAGSRTPIYYPDPSAGGTDTPPGSGATTCPQVRAHVRYRLASTGRLAYLPHSMW